MIKASLDRATKALNQFAAEKLPSNRLSGQDTLFLHLDQPHAATHGTMIYIYDQSTVAGKKIHFQDVLKHVQERLATSRHPRVANRVMRCAEGTPRHQAVESLRRQHHRIDARDVERFIAA